VAILRRPDLPREIVPQIGGTDTLYEVDLAAVPSLPWRAAFLRLSLPFNPSRCLEDLRPFASRTGSAPRRTPNGDPRVPCGV
jgi:hypothetical protein